MAGKLRKGLAFLGLVEQEEEFESFDEMPVVAEQPRHEQHTQVLPKASVTPIRKPAAVQRPASSGEMSRIVTRNPRKYSDVQELAEAFREGSPVIINISQLPEGDARRLLDFASGFAVALSGKIQKITHKIFLMTPENVLLSGENVESIELDTASNY